jgi:hypothetical protein
MSLLGKVGVLCDLTGGSPEEIIKHTPNVYEWRGVYYEITGYKSKTAPASHYSTYTYMGKQWSVRELGEKSLLLKQLKGKYA